MSTTAGMADVDMTATAASAAIATAAADISTADISTAAVVTVAVAAVVVVAAAAERTADHAGQDGANNCPGNSQGILVTPIIDLLDGGVGPDHLRSGRIDRCGRSGREAEEQAGTGSCCNSNERHATILWF